MRWLLVKKGNTGQEAVQSGSFLLFEMGPIHMVCHAATGRAASEEYDPVSNDGNAACFSTNASPVLLVEPVAFAILCESSAKTSKGSRDHRA